MSDAPQGLVQPDPKEVVLCVYEPTLDGFAAAWVVRKAFRDAQIPVEFAILPTNSTVGADGRNAIELGKLPAGTSNGARSRLVFGAGKTPAAPTPLPFKEWERVFPYGVKTTAKEPNTLSAFAGTSLVGATWNFFYGATKRPFVLEQIDDRIAGTKKFKDSNDTYACADSYPQDFITFGKVVDAGEDRKYREYLVTGGQAINRYLAKHAGKSLRVEEE